MFSDDSIVSMLKEAGPAKGRPPAVLQVVPSLVSGGVERGTVDLAGALVAAGWTAYVASAGGPMEKELARTGAQHIALPLASKNPLVIRRNGKALTEIIRRCKIDIVHARSRAPAWSAWSAARATARRFVTTFHNAYDADLPLKHRYNSVMARGDRVIAISQFVAEHVAKVYGIGADRLCAIPRQADGVRAGRCRGFCLDRSRGLRAGHRRSAGDGTAGSRHGPRRGARDDPARHRLARAAARPCGARYRDRSGAGARSGRAGGV